MINRVWIIINVKSQSALCGAYRKTLMFSTEEIARELAIQMFKEGDEFIIFNTSQLNNH